MIVIAVQLVAAGKRSDTLRRARGFIGGPRQPGRASHETGDVTGRQLSPDLPRIGPSGDEIWYVS
ncbi:hypothetical protein BO83DRAFT_381019 [Aspergillus eucalypticola CBS 122712]|uniref:Uncharacterized protein n=1 Tax=Aspergillus eucalypticola (strain CBS 122712 / IBT 29274) TaxID=1448314 RepID=A0A317V0R8_ASPEC|nr:uncharacterized protein BO83DRAFT_381019 [Aspergillus eucalypticola CBS 122712]PWY66668.1 hypothetical protein BO83DRAFT_381019 [Aspergillus eucalypticola CBS 122712]